MPITAFPNGISSFGVPLIGSTPLIPPTTGKYFWVDSATGKDNNGRAQFPDQSQPLATLAYAVSKARSAKGDVIILFPSHAESITTATALDINKSGLTIIGLGNRGQRPTFTLSTVVGATFKVSGAETIIDNIIIDMSGINTVTNGVTVTGAGVTFRNCKFILNAGATAVANAFLVSANRFSLETCMMDGTAAGTGTATLIASGAAIDELRVVNCDIRGNFSTAVFSSTSTNHITDLTIAYNAIRQANGTAKNIFNLTTSSTGLIFYNVFNGTTWSTAADVASNSSNVALRWFQNYGFDDGAGVVSGVLVPAAGTIA